MPLSWICARAGSSVAVWAVFLALTALHIYANVRAVRALHVRTINAARFEALLQEFASSVRLAPPLQCQPTNGASRRQQAPAFESSEGLPRFYVLRV